MPYKKYVNSNYIKAYGYIHTINVYRSNAENNKVYPRRLNGIKLGAFDVEIEPRKRKTILKKKGYVSCFDAGGTNNQPYD